MLDTDKVQVQRPTVDRYLELGLDQDVGKPIYDKAITILEKQFNGIQDLFYENKDGHPQKIIAIEVSIYGVWIAVATYENLDALKEDDALTEYDRDFSIPTEAASLMYEEMKLHLQEKAVELQLRPADWQDVLSITIGEDSVTLDYNEIQPNDWDPKVLSEVVINNEKLTDAQWHLLRRCLTNQLDVHHKLVAEDNIGTDKRRSDRIFFIQRQKTFETLCALDGQQVGYWQMEQKEEPNVMIDGRRLNVPHSMMVRLAVCSIFENLEATSYETFQELRRIVMNYKDERLQPDNDTPVEPDRRIKILQSTLDQYEQLAATNVDCKAILDSLKARHGFNVIEAWPEGEAGDALRQLHDISVNFSYPDGAAKHMQ